MSCSGQDCANEAGTLKCPTCLKFGIDSVYCSQTCFKRNWSKHKSVHPQESGKVYDPFPALVYTGSVRAVYPLSPRRLVKAGIVCPDYAEDGEPTEEIEAKSGIEICDAETIEKIRNTSRLAREVIDIAGRAVKPGITTDEIDRIVHEACMERGAYPSPLNYYFFPKSVCTSVNEVICHGIPDQRPLEDGDIVNIDVTLYKDGVHSDMNHTYYVGSASKNPDVVRLVEGTRRSLDAAIALVKPGCLIRSLGNEIERVAKEYNLSVVRSYTGHGVGKLFHSDPNVPHYANNKAVGVCQPGMVFTIEPMLCLGTYRDSRWPDNWTAVTKDGKYSAQFEHTLLVTETGVEVLTRRNKRSPGGPIDIPKKK
ncbi:methionine aminopeptidase [Starmerella bacillaris]|uniref:Methionine aminopeptidase n=1 Tax=Starmerella bacillaris TaxID=1247836 RepID=A0AAV5RFH1_STABA|nr:methionine aminopeptidase [Starmerella bacillaris]